MEGVLVRIVQGNEKFKETTTGVGGQYTFEGIHPGIYNVVAMYPAENPEKVTTILVVVTVADIYLPASETNSVLTVDHDAPDVVVGSLEEEADSVRGSADGAGADKVEVSMDIVPTGEAEKPIPVRAIREKAKEAHPRAELGLILEIDVAKTITTGGTDNREDINTTDNVLELVIPYDLTGKSGVPEILHLRRQLRDGNDPAAALHRRRRRRFLRRRTDLAHYGLGRRRRHDSASGEGLCLQRGG